MADTKKKATGTRKKTGTSYKSSTKRYKNTTLYRTTATNRKRYSTGTRESTMTVHYRSVPNNPKKPKTATKKTPAKASTAKKTATKTAVKPSASSRPTIEGRPMTDRELEFYKLGLGKPSKIKATQSGSVPLKGTSNSELHAYQKGQREARDAERRYIDTLPRSTPTLANEKKIGTPIYPKEGKYTVKASFLSKVNEKLPRAEKMSMYNRNIYAMTRETEKAVYCSVETIRVDGEDQRRDVWIPKSCIEVH